MEERLKSQAQLMSSVEVEAELTEGPEEKLAGQDAGSSAGGGPASSGPGGATLAPVSAPGVAVRQCSATPLGWGANQGGVQV
jgi:hypothetical protein